MMMKSSIALIALAIACASLPAFAADLTPDEGSELRSRADGLIAERQRNPGWDGGTTRLSQSRGDVNLNQDRGDVKTPRQGDLKTKVKGGKRPKGESVKKKVRRAVDKMPGALLRDR
jgi:hypothetical protein